MPDTPKPIAPLTPLPEPPSRKVADQGRFDDMAYQSLKAQKHMAEELNQDFIPTVNAMSPAVSDAFEHRDIIHAAAGNAAEAALCAARSEKGAQRAESAAAKTETEADKILTLSVSAHASNNDNVAADYSPETGMLHLYIPKGEAGNVGLQGPTGAQGGKGEQGDRGEKGVQGPVGSTGTAPLLDILCCGGASATHITTIYGGQAASFGG